MPESVSIGLIHRVVSIQNFIDLCPLFSKKGLYISNGYYPWIISVQCDILLFLWHPKDPMICPIMSRSHVCKSYEYRQDM